MKIFSSNDNTKMFYKKNIYSNKIIRRIIYILLKIKWFINLCGYLIETFCFCIQNIYSNDICNFFTDTKIFFFFFERSK